MKSVLIFCLLGLLFFSSCKSHYPIVGTYNAKDGGKKTTLILDNQNRFKFKSSIEILNIYSAGKWWRFNDSLYLRSDEYVTLENGSVKERVEEDINNYTTIQTLEKNGDTLINIAVLINDNNLVYSDTNGLIKYPQKVNSVFIRFYDRYDFYYTTKITNSNHLFIYLAGINSDNKYFTLRKFIIKKNQLIDAKVRLIKE